MLFLRHDVEATILRLPGQTFQSTETSIKNVYTVKLINKTTEDIEDVDIKLISHEGTVDLIGGNLNITKQALQGGTLFIEINKKELIGFFFKFGLFHYTKIPSSERARQGRLAGPLI